MNKIIYAIKIGELTISGLRVINVKIGQTTDINSTLRQYKRSNPTAEILDLWMVNPSLSPSECEKGIHILAEKYAYERKKETFIFLQESYQDFAENVNLLFKNLTDKNKKERKIRRRGIRRSTYIGRRPKLIRFRGKEYRVSTWREILCKISQEIYKDKKDLTPALGIKGRKRIYFSKDKRGLVDPQEIEGTPYFCEGNLNADHIVKIVKILLNIFGYKTDDLEIIYK